MIEASVPLMCNSAPEEDSGEVGMVKVVPEYLALLNIAKSEINPCISIVLFQVRPLTDDPIEIGIEFDLVTFDPEYFLEPFIYKSAEFEELITMAM